jgi:hypothetical protein
MRRWTRRRPEPIDRLLVGLSRSGERSRLWIGLAAAGVAFGRRVRRDHSNCVTTPHLFDLDAVIDMAPKSED